MKLIQEHRLDERLRTSAGRVAAIWLGVTQVLLAGVIFYRLYVLGQPDSGIRDFQAVLAISIFGHIALSLYLGGLFPVPTWKGAVTAYLVLMAMVVGGCLIIYGVPPVSDWTSTWLPALAGSALFVGLYWLAAWLGRWQLERKIRE